jgi:hypothetical protein
MDNEIPLIERCVIVTDRFNTDFSRINIGGELEVSFFVISHKGSIKFKVVKERQRPENRRQHLLKSELLESTGAASKKNTQRY